MSGIRSGLSRLNLTIGCTPPALECPSSSQDNLRVNTAALNDALRRGAALHQAGQLAEAEALYRQVLAEAPHHPDALHLLGLIAQAAGQYEAAIDLIEQAVARQPDFPVAYYNLGRIFYEQGQLDRAAAALRRSLELKPDYADAYNHLGGVLHRQGRLEESANSYRQALTLNPDYAEAHSNLGTVLQDLGRPDQAAAAYRQALALKPDYVEALHNLGEVLQDLHQLDAALASYRRALQLRPDYPEAHCGLALALLRTADLRQGFIEYERRWQHPDYVHERRELPGQAWDGADPAGKRVFLYAEQGFGDTLQFARYVPLVAARGAQVVLECQPELLRLLRPLAGIETIIARGQPLPPFDVHASLMSLPRLFGTELATIPADVPYLSPSEELAGAWRARLSASAGLRVGLAWAGNPRNQQARARRSMSLAELVPLNQAAGARFFSLQKGAGADETATAPAGLHIVDIAADIEDFADTAAAMQSLDLVVTVDTAAAHLAGALGRPVWVMLPYAAEWRWLLNRSDTPWYPSMRLFRQPIWGNWGPVVAEVATQLATLSRSHGR